MSCIVMLITTCHAEPVHTASEGATAAWVDFAGLRLVAPVQMVMAV